MVAKNPLLTFMSLPTINRQILLVGYHDQRHHHQHKIIPTILNIITNTIPIMTKVLAINVQQLITGYGIGFSAPCLAQLVILIDMVNDDDYHGD